MWHARARLCRMAEVTARYKTDKMLAASKIAQRLASPDRNPFPTGYTLYHTLPLRWGEAAAVRQPNGHPKASISINFRLDVRLERPSKGLQIHESKAENIDFGRRVRETW